MYQNEINSKARKLARVISNQTLPVLDLSEDHGAPKYNGSFKEIYKLVQEGKIKLLTEGSNVLGISVDSGMASIELDNIAGRNFGKVYDMYTAEKYIKAALILQQSGVQVGDIDKDKIYLYRDGKILNLNCDVIVELSDEQLQNATMENIRELLDKAYDEKYHQCAPARQSNVSRQSGSLPSQVTIPAGEAGNVKRYLRQQYGHYLAKGVEPQVRHNADGSVEVSGIEWGRTI